MTTYITFVLDETGSMSPTRDDTIGSFNTYVADLIKGLENEVKFSLMKFGGYAKDWMCLDVAMKHVTTLSHSNYIPRGGTPLWDAFAFAIKQMEEKDIKEDDKVIITILTDGEENQSNEYTQQDVKAMVEDHPEWAITFLGANMDAWDDVGAGIGMHRGQTWTYDQDDMYGTMTGQSAGTIAFAVGESSVETFYDNVTDSKLTDSKLTKITEETEDDIN